MYYDRMTRNDLILILLEKDQYMTALEKQLEALKVTQPNSRFKSLEEDEYINQSDESGLQVEHISMIKGWYNHTMTPLSASKSAKSQLKCSQGIRQKVISDSIDISRFTVEDVQITKSDRLFDEIGIIELQHNQSPKVIYSFPVVNCQNKYSFIIAQCNPKKDITEIINQDYEDHYLVTVDDYNYICIKYLEFRIQQKNMIILNRIIYFKTTLNYFQFYRSILRSVLLDLKSKRCYRFQQYRQYASIDASFVDNLITEYNSLFTQLSLTEVPIQQSKMLFNKQWYELTQQDDFQHEILPVITPKQLIQIFLCLLTEVSLVFIGDLKLITYLIHFCKGLISPFTWIHPSVNMLPYQFISLLDSPVPILIGIEYLEQKIIDSHKNIVFFNLKESKFYNQDLIPLISQQLMSQFLSSMTAKFQVPNVYNVFQKFIQVHILKHIKKNDSREQIQSRMSPSDRALWRKVTSTQIFIQYLEK